MPGEPLPKFNMAGMRLVDQRQGEANRRNLFQRVFRRTPTAVAPAAPPQNEVQMLPRDITFDDLLADLDNMPEFKRFSQYNYWDWYCTDSVILYSWLYMLSFDHGAKRAVPPNSETQIARLTDADYRERLNILSARFKNEAIAANKALIQIGYLLDEARNDMLRNMPVSPPYEYGASAVNDDLTLAATWVASASTSCKDHLPASIDAIKALITRVLQWNVDLRSFETARYINENLPYRGVRQFRDFDSSRPFCGMIGGLMVNKAVSQMSTTLPGVPTTGWYPGRRAANTLDPAVQRRWANLGCFLLAGYVRGHGFGDGNGRTARVLYACALLKGEVPFVAPMPGPVRFLVKGA